MSIRELSIKVMVIILSNIFLFSPLTSADPPVNVADQGSSVIDVKAVRDDMCTLNTSQQKLLFHALYDDSVLKISPFSNIFGHFGFSVGSAGDVNGDGFSDIFVSAPFYNSKEGSLRRGSVWVIYGSNDFMKSMRTDSVEYDNLNMALGTEGEVNNYGHSVTSADYNGDGYSDIIVGVPYHNEFKGAVMMYPGGPNGISAKPEWYLLGMVPTFCFGLKVNLLGDVNGDGFDDIAIIGQSHIKKTDLSLIPSGILFGSDATPEFRSCPGMKNDPAFRNNIYAAGDIDNDGYDDIFVEYVFPADNSSMINVYKGTSAGPERHPAISFKSNHDTRQSVGVTDFDSDKYSDLIAISDAESNASKQVHVYYGRDDGVSEPVFVVSIQTMPQMSLFCDINGDKYADFLMVTNKSDEERGSRKIIVFLNDNGLSISGKSVTIGKRKSFKIPFISRADDPPSFAYTAACGGDINGDAMNELLVGEYYANKMTGAIYIIFGPINKDVEVE